jgi:lipoate-protein ligase A
LIEESFAERAPYDTAVSRALLEEVAAGTHPEALRLHRPGDVVAFSVLDRVRPGFGDAVDAVRDAGFDAVLRLAGGRAAVFHPDTIAFAWCIPDADPRRGIQQRFDLTAQIFVTALRTLGVDARVGEVEGEYCPGAHSVNARGKTKLMGVGQRIVRGSAHVGGVLVLAGAARVREALVPAYRAMGFDWRPDTVGAVDEEVAGLAREEVEAALRDAFTQHVRLEPARLPASILEAASVRESDHAV